MSKSPAVRPVQDPSRTHVFFAPLSAFFFMLARPRLIGIALIPSLINIALFAMIVMLSNWLLITPLVDRIAFRWEAAESFLRLYLRIVLTALSLLVAALVCYLLVIPIGAPFCDKLSELVEKEMLAHRPHLIAPSSTFTQGVYHSVRDAFRRVAVVIPVVVFVFLLGWVPIIGPPLALTLSFLFNALFLAMDGYSYAMDRRFQTFPEKWRYLSANRRIWVPYGFALAIIALIPCNIIWLPLVSSVAATRLYCERLLERDSSQEAERVIGE